jgi:hypothetical protein
VNATKYDRFLYNSQTANCIVERFGRVCVIEDAFRAVMTQLTEPLPGSSRPQCLSQVRVSAGFVDLVGIASNPEAPTNEYTVLLDNETAVIVVQNPLPGLYAPVTPFDANPPPVNPPRH